MRTAKLTQSIQFFQVAPDGGFTDSELTAQFLNCSPSLLINKIYNLMMSLSFLSEADNSNTA